MDGYGSNNMQISVDLSTYCEASSDPPDPSLNHGVQLSVSDLGNWLSDSLNIQNVQKVVCGIVPSPDKNDTIHLIKDHSNNFHAPNMDNLASKKFFNKSATFPSSSEVGLLHVDKQRERESEQTAATDAPSNTANQPCLRSVSLPTPLKLVSAMKGSREKLGFPAKKLSVTWAPDVYDPPPSAVSHVPSNKSQRRRSDGKKNGKNKQKVGKSTRGTKGKDKKQARKHGGSSSRCYKPIEDEEKEVSLGEQLPAIVDFDVGSPDAFCGSSFLKKSVTNLHFSLAEAT